MYEASAQQFCYYVIVPLLPFSRNARLASAIDKPRLNIQLYHPLLHNRCWQILTRNIYLATVVLVLGIATGSPTKPTLVSTVIYLVAGAGNCNQTTNKTHLSQYHYISSHCGVLVLGIATGSPTKTHLDMTIDKPCLNLKICPNVSYCPLSHMSYIWCWSETDKLATVKH